MEAIDYQNYDKWQSINDLNCNDIDISYINKVRLYQYYDVALHVLCMIEFTNRSVASITNNNYYDLKNEGFITKHTFLIVKGLFLRDKIKIGSKTFMKNIVTFLRNEKNIRSIKLDNILSEEDIDYTEEFIQWYPFWNKTNELINLI